jgi:hypothetical protein
MGNEMSYDELQRLNDLRDSGALSDVEFGAEKARLLGLRTPSVPKVAPSGPVAQDVQRQLERLKQEVKPTKQPKKKLSRTGRISFALLAVVVLAVVVVQVISSSGPSPKFRATATATQIFSPGSLGVAFNVQNIGQVTGAPSCTITAAATASEGGVNIVNLPSISPGHWDYESTAADRVSVSGNAASQVDINNGGMLITCT